MSTIEKIIDRIWAAQNQGQQAEQAVQQKQQQITLPKSTQAPAQKPVQTVKPVDNRTTAQKVADSQAAYDSYMGSEEKKQNQQAANRKALQETIDRLFAVPGTTMGEMPLGVASPVPVDQKERELKATADYYKGQQQAEQDRAVMDADLKEYESWSEQDKADLDRYITERDRNQSNLFDAPQFDTYNLNPLVQKYGFGKVRQMAESLQRSRNEQTMAQAQAAAEKAAQERPGLSSIASVGANLIGSYTGPVEIAKEMANRTGRYQTMDPNNLGGLASEYGGTVRQGVAQRIEGEDGNWLRKIAAIGYEGLMSAADSTARMAAGGFNPGVSAAIAASGSFGNSLRQYSAQGASPEQAAAAALVTSGIEYLTEKIPMDELLKVGKSGSAVKDVLKQAFLTEPTTEEISLFGNVLAEAVILGQKSDRSQRIGELIAGGASYEDAQKQVNQELLNEAARTYAVSAISGGLSAGGTAIVNGSQNRPMSLQDSMDSVVASYMPNIPKDQPVQMTEQQRAVQQAADEVMGVKPVEQTAEVAHAQPEIAGSKEHISMEDYANNESPVWRNVAYEDDATKASITQQLHDDMVTSGNVVQIAEAVSKNVDETLPDLRGMKKAERAPILKQAFNTLKNDLRKFLNGFNGQNFEFEVNGKVLDARLYNTGIKEVLEKVTKDKAKMLYTTEDIFRNARYLYSTPDYGGDTNVYRWNYFYTPVRIGNDVVGVRIAVRDMIKQNESQIYNWNIKKDAPLGGARDDLESRKPSGASSGTSDGIITEPGAEVKGTGAAEQNFSGKAEYQDLLYEGNVQRDRQGDVRPMEVPRTDVNGNPVSAVAANVYGSQYTPDDLASETESAILRGDLSYIEITNDEAAESANRNIESAGGWREAYIQWHDEVRDGKTGAEMAARGALLLNHAAEVYEQTKATGDEVTTKAAKQEWVSILVDVRAMGTNTAQGLQAMRMIRELAPPDKLDFAVASIKRMVSDMKLQEEVEIDENLLNEYRMAETDEQRDEIMAEIQQNVADQIPSTFLDKWTALRYMNMLGNLKTNVRNVAGNVGSMVLYRVKDQVAAAVEKMAGTERTKSNFVGRELLQACKEDFQQVKAAINSGGKYNERMAAADEFRQGVMDKRRIYSNPIAEGYRKVTNWMMNNEYFGDEAFGRAAYSRALAGYLKAKGYDAAAMQNGSIEDSVMDAARAYAIREAQEATFRDNSKLAEVATRVQRATGVVGQGIMPFTKTPANVLTRAVEFSPLGLIDTAVKARKKAKGNQDITGADVVNSLSKSLTGTALVGLGWLLKDQGFLSGGPDDDEEKEKFNDLNGAQNYAITLPNGTSYTIDWLTPAAMPLFMGAQIADVVNKDGDFTFSDLFDVFTSIADPMVQMSMLQGLNDTLDGIKYTDNNLGQFFINAAVSYLTQGLTNTLAGQIERSTEENRQTTYIDKGSWVPTQIQQALGKASQKIPIWDYQQMDYRNAWGETEENEGGLFYNLLSPGYLSKEKRTALSDELVRLREATGENVFPQTVEKTVSYTDTSGTKHVDHNLTQEELEKMQTTQGQTAAKLLGDIVEHPDYKAMTDQQKARTMEAVYEYAREQGKKAALSDYHSEAASWIRNATGSNIHEFMNRGTMSEIERAVESTVDSITNGWTVTEAEEKELDETYDAFAKMGHGAKQSIIDSATGDTARYLEARSKGVPTESYLQAVEAVEQLKPEKGKNKVSETQKREAIAASGLPDKTIDALMKAYMTDYDPEDEKPDKTELRYDYARQELGLSPAEYAAAYRVQAEGGKKAEKIAAWMEQGYTKQEATILYNLFQANKINVVDWHNSKTK